MPVIDFTNTKGIHITQTDHQATMVVNMHGKPRLGDDTQPEECECMEGPGEREMGGGDGVQAEE